jgi:thiamine biosynthesis lipoprotein
VVRAVASALVCAAAGAPLAPVARGQTDSIFYESRPAMGTTFDIYLYARDAARAAELFTHAFEEIERVEALLSNYRAESELSRLNARAAHEAVTTDPELYALLARSLAFSRLTGGAFDISVGSLMAAWGFFRGQGHYPTVDALAHARAQTGWRNVLLDPEQRTVRYLVPGLQLDAGAIGKGYALDRVAELLRTLGVSRALIGSGASSYIALGAPPGKAGWLIHVHDPLDEARIVSSVTLHDRSLSTSGSLQKFFELDGRRYGHIMDPRTGAPVAGRLQVTVITANATDSDALATALFVLGPVAGRAALDHVRGSALFMEADVVGTRIVALEWPHAAAISSTRE